MQHRRRRLLAHLRRRREARLLPRRRRARYRRGGLERFAGQAEIPFRGIAPATLTTPGAVASFCEAHARHGRLPLTRCFEDAIHYARDGFPVTARLSRWIEQTAPEFDAASKAIFLPGGKAPGPGAFSKLAARHDVTRDRRPGARRVLRG